ncbi:MAG TPA: DNA-3-methyladenine glycosylase [Solirubrobacteraceae bacterium]
MRQPATAADRPAGLGAGFYDRPVVEVARDLVGCLLSHGETAGVIVETEAYHHSEPACHAYVGLTSRTSTLFGPPGIAYVYRSYGIHALLNAVCEGRETGAAVLLRALEPVAGLQLMRLRRGGPARERDLCSGPGKLTQALDIELVDNRSDLSAGPVRISTRPPGWERPEIVADRRIGITRAVELPWRFCAAGSRFLSRPVSRWAQAAATPGAP